MRETNVSQSSAPTADDVLARLQAALGGLTPEQGRAAAYVLEHPHCVGVSTVRELAEFAGVKPNTLVRLARAVGFAGYDELRAPFRAGIRDGSAGFPDRARFLQSLRAEGRLGELYARTVDEAIRNLEETFARIGEARLRAAAEAIRAARRTFVLGVGVQHANASGLAYLASTGMSGFEAVPAAGSTATDALARAGPGDVLIAVTTRPYRREVVEAVRLAREQGVTVIGISDSPASPVVAGAAHGFVVRVDTPQFFPSSVAVVALLETLLSFVIALAGPEVVARVERFHRRRARLGLYVEEGGSR